MYNCNLDEKAVLYLEYPDQCGLSVNGRNTVFITADAYREKSHVHTVTTAKKLTAKRDPTFGGDLNTERTVIKKIVKKITINKYYN